VSTLGERLSKINSNISAITVGRASSPITLLAVSKHQPVSLMIDYATLVAAQGGVPVFGENYVQEYSKKREQLNLPHRVHMIGPLQSNKVRAAVSLFDVIESVHSLAIAQAINREAQCIDKSQAIYLQVNVSGDDAKSGFALQDVMQFVERDLPTFKHVNLAGVMTITRQYDQPTDARGDFTLLAKIAAQLRGVLGCEIQCSMGMSSDYEVAIEQGATEVRLGTALFGERDQ